MFAVYPMEKVNARWRASHRESFAAYVRWHNRLRAFQVSTMAVLTLILAFLVPAVTVLAVPAISFGAMLVGEGAHVWALLNMRRLYDGRLS